MPQEHGCWRCHDAGYITVSYQPGWEYCPNPQCLAGFLLRLKDRLAAEGR
ncbi:MAG: hypothetical protein ACOYY2_13060 [Actinomycetota bacterium]